MTQALPLELLVERVEPVAENIVAIDLTAPGAGPLPEWAPGAHIDLGLGEGLVRQYSLMGSPADRARYRVAILREKTRMGSADADTDAAEAATRLLGWLDHNRREKLVAYIEPDRDEVPW